MIASAKYSLGFALVGDDEMPQVSLMRVEDCGSQTQLWYGLPSELVALYSEEVAEFTEPSRRTLEELLSEEQRFRQADQ